MQAPKMASEVIPVALNLFGACAPDLSPLSVQSVELGLI